MGTWTIDPDDLSSTRTGLGLGNVATYTVGSSNGNVPVVQSDGKLLSSIVPVTDVAPDLRLLALQSASDRIGLQDGIADPYSDASDIDASASTNEVHNSTTKYFSAVTTGDMFDVAGATITFDPAVSLAGDAYDNDLVNSASWGSGAPDNNHIQIDLGSGVTRSAISYSVAWSNNGFSSGYGTIFTYKLQGSNDGTNFTDVDSQTNITHNGNIADTYKKYSFAKTTAYRYWRIILVSSNGTYVGFAECEIEFSLAENMTLVSNAFTASSAPSNAVIGIPTVENETATINTDITAEVSRDGGTTFTACTLALKTSLGATGTKYYESASTDISGQPSGTSMKYRVKTLNDKDIEIHGTTLKWS